MPSPPQAERCRHRPGVRRRLGRAVRPARTTPGRRRRSRRPRRSAPASRPRRPAGLAWPGSPAGRYVQHSPSRLVAKMARVCAGLSIAFSPGPGGDAGVRHHQVEHPGRRHPRLHRRLVRYIDGLGQRGRAAGLAGVANRLQPAVIAAGQMQHHAGRGERQRQRLADPGGGAAVISTEGYRGMPVIIAWLRRGGRLIQRRHDRISHR